MKDHARAERRSRSLEEALHGPADATIKAERAERYAGMLRVERGAGAFRLRFPRLSDPDESIRRAAFREARPILADVKAIAGRKYDAVEKAWVIPLDAADSVELIAEQYGATIEQASDERDRIIAELSAQVAELTADLEIAYGHVCGQAVAA